MKVKIHFDQVTQRYEVLHEDGSQLLLVTEAFLRDCGLTRHLPVGKKFISVRLWIR